MHPEPKHQWLDGVVNTMKHKYVIVIQEADIRKMFPAPEGKEMSIETIDITEFDVEVKFTLEDVKK